MDSALVWDRSGQFVVNAMREGRRRSYFQSHIFTKQSLPPLTNLLAALLSWLPAALTKLPGRLAGAQLTLFTPRPCAPFSKTCSQALFVNSRTEMLPSEEAQASKHPHSCGAQDSRLTEAVCSVDSKTF